MRLTEKQRAVLERVAAGETLRFEVGIGYHLVGQPGTYRSTTIARLAELGLLKELPYGPDDNHIDFAITAAGFEALGIKQGTGTTEGMVSMAVLDQAAAALGADKPITSSLFIPDLGLIDLPEMAAEDQANLLALLRKNVPDFGHRAGYLESGIVDLGDQAVLVLSAADEPTYMAIFCESQATALAIVSMYALGEGLELESARRFDPDGNETPLDLGGL